jgi:hypothetical protein
MMADVGLAIHWELALAEESETAAAEKVRALHEAALAAGFGEVGEVVEAWSERHPAGETEMAQRAWVLSQGLVKLHPAGAMESIRVAPVHAVAFRAGSPGTEDAVFGLASYTRDDLSGYRWSGGCSTQGAAKRGGMPAFLKAHRAICQVLDKARSVGLKLVVRDDGGFWESRDPKTLFDRLEQWEHLLAGLGRKSRDAGGKSPLASQVLPTLEARKKPRKDRPVIEDLEG